MAYFLTLQASPRESEGTMNKPRLNILSWQTDACLIYIKQSRDVVLLTQRICYGIIHLVRYAKFSEKLTFLTPVYQVIRIVSFSKNFVYVLNE